MRSAGKLTADITQNFQRQPKQKTASGRGFFSLRPEAVRFFAAENADTDIPGKSRLLLSQRYRSRLDQRNDPVRLKGFHNRAHHLIFSGSLDDDRI